MVICIWIFPKEQIDHINRIRTDNRICNLRECSNINNQWNTNIRKDNTSGIKNIHWDNKSKEWRVQFNANKKIIYLGYFDNVELAKIALKKAKNEYRKNFYII